ncbi:MAG: SDR family NAD(P)-dependent oxidoreductase [Burkholderiales bacterium]|nr:SDR family NAD(P)-dependent oxidoreductase [Burkholderiales bacterium]
MFTPDYRPAPDLLAQRVILVTGASSGLGREAALAFARHGATVILHGRNTKRLEKLYDEIEGCGAPQPIILPLDLARAGEVDYANVEQAIRARAGRLDGLLHSAAHFAHLTELAHESLEHWLTTLRVNSAAVHALTRACLPLLRAAPDASVVATAEMHGLQPAAYWGAFAVSQGALLGWITILAQEWAPLPGLRVNLLVPGAVASPLRSRTHPGETQASRLAPAALVPLWLYLMGPDSRGVSGQVFEASKLLAR